MPNWYARPTCRLAAYQDDRDEEHPSSDMLAIACALLAAAAFGVSDFAGGVASRRTAAITVMLVAYPAAIPAFAVIAMVGGGEIDAATVIFGSLAGLAQGLGMWWLFLALAGGQMSVVAPATALLAAGVPVLAGIGFGERPGIRPLLGIIVALAAVVLISHSVDHHRVDAFLSARTAWLTLGAGVMSGMVLILLHNVSETSGVWPLVYTRSAASAVVLVIAARTRNLALPAGLPLRLAACIAVADVFANAAMLYALQQYMLSLASVLIALYPAITVALAVTLQGERITRSQQIGLALGATAIAAIASGT